MSAARQRRSRVDDPTPSGPYARKDSVKLQQERPVPSSMPASDFEWILPALYPMILLVGSAFSVISPDVRQSRDSGVPAPSYFARKSNFLNVYFVKVGWAWTTLAFILFVLLQPRASSSQPSALMQRRSQAVIRLGVLTLWWIAVSQWFFGPALMERSFRLTGGACELQSLRSLHQPFHGSSEATTEAKCRLLGGTWKGGYDISGHVFILVLSSAALFLEARPFWRLEEHKAREPPAEVANSTARTGGDEERGWTAEFTILTIVVALDVWMLLMTAIYFHTFSEKVTGLLVSYAGLAVVYYLPRFSQTVFTILGRPGR